MTRFLLIVLVAFAGYWTYQKGQPEPAATGYIQVQMPTNYPQGKVMIVAAQNCSKKAAKHAEFLARSLKQQGIPYARTSSISFDSKSREELEAVEALVKQGPPLVFYEGRGQSNPSWEDVQHMIGKEVSAAD